MNPDGTTPPPPPVTPVAPASQPVTPPAPVVTPASPKRTWLWVSLALLALLLVGGFGSYFLFYYPAQKMTAYPIPSPMLTTLSPSPSTAPTVSQSDTDSTLEQEINSTVVEEDTSGYSAIETDLQGL